MKKNILKLLTIFCLVINLFTINTFANINISIDTNVIEKKNNVTKGEIFNFLASYYTKQIPETFKYIQLNFKDIKKGSNLESSLQKLIYLNLIDNYEINIHENSKVSAWLFFRLSEKVLGIKIIDRESKKALLTRKANKKDIQTIKKFLNNEEINIDFLSSNKALKYKKAILNDVYKTITTKHYEKKSIEKMNLLNSAIEGLVKGTKDKHTVYFPPIKSKTFHDTLSGKYEGIGSYVEMEKPGVLKITSPIPGSPSEKAGLKGGDIILKVDKKTIKTENSLREVITWIKGPAGTNVLLTINRKGKIIKIVVTRAKITITDIETKNINVNTYYIH